MEEINLFSKYDIKPKKKYWITVPIIIVLGLFLLDYFRLKNRVVNAESNLNLIVSEIEGEGIKSDSSEYDTVRKVQVLENEKLNSETLLESIILLCSLDNQDLVFQDIQMNREELNLTGFCWSRDDAYSLIDGLKDLGYEFKLTGLDSVDDYYLFKVNGGRYE